MSQSKSTKQSKGQRRLHEIFSQGHLRQYIDDVNALTGSHLTYQYAYQVAVGKRTPSLYFISVFNSIKDDRIAKISSYEWSDDFLPIESHLQRRLIELGRENDLLALLDKAQLTAHEKSKVIHCVCGSDEPLEDTVLQKLASVMDLEPRPQA